MKKILAIQISIALIAIISSPNKILAQFNGGIGSGYAKAGKTNISLPVHFISLEGKNYYKYNQITWNVENEINVKKYHVEKSKSGIDFFEIGAIEPSVYNSTTKKYQFNDFTIESVIVYYRIVEEDNDGKSTISPILKLYPTQQSEIILYPNPAENFVSISNLPATNNSSLNYKIIDSKGSLLQFKQIDGTSISINIAEIPKGLYYIIIIQQNEIISSKAFYKL